MQCSCGRKAVYHRRYSGQHLCARCFRRMVEKKFMETVRTNGFIAHTDTVACGVSGGKDSLVLLHLLHGLQKKVRFSLFALAIDEGIAGYRDRSLPYVTKACETLGVPLHVRSFKDSFGYALDEVTAMKERVGACSYCGVFRRSLLNSASRELGATKLALGHNLDDESQVILMNMLRGDFARFGRMGTYRKHVNDQFVPRIKPLREIPEKEIVLYAVLAGIDFDFEECPYAPEAFRDEVRQFLNTMEEGHPGTKHALLRTYDKLYPFLNEALQPSVLPSCERCGEPSIRPLCKKCELLDAIRDGLARDDQS